MKLHSIVWDAYCDRMGSLRLTFVGSGVREFQVHYGVGFGDDSADTVRALRDMANMIENRSAEVRAAAEVAKSE